MENELRAICEYLGHFDKDGFEVLSAIKHEDGTWSLVVKALPEKQEATNDKNN